MANIHDGIIIWTFFLFASFSILIFLTLFKHFWSNKTGKGSLSKVVQRVQNYLQLNFQKDWSSTSEVMADIRDGIIIRTFFLFLLFHTKFSGAIWALLVKWKVRIIIPSRISAITSDVLDQSFWNWVVSSFEPTEQLYLSFLCLFHLTKAPK